MFDAFIKGLCKYRRFAKLHKCRRYESREYGVGIFTKKKWRVSVRGLNSVLVNGSKIVYIISFITINNDFFMLKFIATFLYLPTLPKPITTNFFQYVDTLQPFFQNLSLLLKLSAWKLLNTYSSSLQIYLLITLHFRAQFSYKSVKVFILWKNLVLALVDIKIIDKRLSDNLKIGSIKELVAKSCLLFISSYLGLMPKHISNWQKIYHFSYYIGRLINIDIPEDLKEMRYTCFQDVL